MKKLLVCFVMLLAVFGAVQAKNLWTGERTYSNGRALPTADQRIVLTADSFTDITVGDRLIFYFTNYADDPITSQHVIRLSTPVTYATLGHNINVSEGDRKASVLIDESLKEKLTTTGLVIGGTGFTMTAITIEAADNTLWEGLKVVNNTGWTVGILESYLFANIKIGDILLISGEKTGDEAVCVLKERSSWKDLHSVIPQGNTFQDFKPNGVSQFSFSLDADALTALKAHGMVVGGSKYNLLSVSLSSTTGIKPLKFRDMSSGAYYNLNGMKVTNKRETTLPKGIYIVKGRKLLVK